MKKHGLLALIIFITFFSCRTVPELYRQGYYLPDGADRTIYLAGEHGRDFLEPMAPSLGIEDYDDIAPLVENTQSFYLVTYGSHLAVQGLGEYNRTFINLAMITSSGWSTTEIAGHKVYVADGMALQVAFPDRYTLLMSMGGIEDLLFRYGAGGSLDFPFDDEDKNNEALLVSMDLSAQGTMALTESFNSIFTSLDLALSPMINDQVLMDFTLKGEGQSGRQLVWAVKLFMVATFGKEGMNSEIVTGSDYAGVVDYLVDYDLIMDLVGL